MNSLSKIPYLWSIVKLAKARDLMSKGRNDKAAGILERINLPDGYKQLAMMLLAKCYAGMNDKDRAIRAYADAIESERSWGKRQDRDASKYIIGYAEFFKSVHLRSKFGGHDLDDLDLYEKLLSMRVPSVIKEDFLPLPPRSSIRVEREQ